MGRVAVDPTALVGPEVAFGEQTEVGPFCRFTGRVQVGEGCRFATGVVVGSEPMDRGYRGEATGVAIGSGNAFFEYATVHRSVGAGTNTVIGSDNYVMAYVHIAHNCRVGNGCTLTNGVQLGGHVQVGDRANIGGLVGVHQFCRVGELAMVGACSYVNKDIPPYVIAGGRPCRVRGLNVVGLRRAGIPDTTVDVLKQAFRIIYRSGLNLSQALDRIESELIPGATTGRSQLRTLTDFAESSRRGIELRQGVSDPEEE